MSLTEEDLERRARKAEENTFHSIVQFIRANMGPGINKISPVTQNIFLSDAGAAHDMSQISAHNIASILYLGTNDPDVKIAMRWKKKKIIFEKLIPPAAQKLDAIKLRTYFSIVYNIVHKYVAREIHILIYCDNGIILSPTAVIYYFLQRFYLTNFDKCGEKLIDEIYYLKNVVEMVKESRKCIAPNDMMIAFLLRCETSMKLHYRTKIAVKLRKKNMHDDDLLDESHSSDAEDFDNPAESAKNSNNQKKSQFNYDELDDLADIAPL